MCEQVHFEKTRREDLVLSRTVLERVFYLMRRHFILGDSSGIMSSSDESDDEIDMGMWMNISDMYKRNFISKPLYDRLWRFVQKTNDAVHAGSNE